MKALLSQFDTATIHAIHSDLRVRETTSIQCGAIAIQNPSFFTKSLPLKRCNLTRQHLTHAYI